jgi:central glycolytic genes regulator
MRDTLDLLRQLIPEVTSLFKRRHDILNVIHYNQPVGRRMLAEKLNASERALRSELDILRKNDLLEVSTAGVSLTEKAVSLLNELQPVISDALGLSYMGEMVAKKLNLSRAVVVPGDSDTDEAVMLNMGRAAAYQIVRELKADSVIAVMGGWTVARVTDMVSGRYPGVTVVPARGGLGENVETQANTVASKLAGRLGGSYKMLHLPENMDPRALETLLNDQRVKSVVATIRQADILLYGIGRADIMAKRRGLSGNDVARLLTKGAVAEALGHYFNARGELVDKAPSLGIEVSDQPHLALSLAVAGGKSKAAAVVAALKKSKGQVLVTDEGAAKDMLEMQ